MKEISTEEVKHIAKLSMLDLGENETEMCRKHLQKMLGYFETLDGVDISKVPPTAHILSEVNVLREDVAMPSMDNEELTANAPEKEDGAYIVPRVVE